jgi:hypothetical protein
VRRALATGISARTIVAFLTGHTHSSVRRRMEQLEKQGRAGRLLPENVEEQIYLWHREMERVQYQEAIMIDLSRYEDRDFAEVHRYAQSLQVLLWPPKLEPAGQENGGQTKNKRLLAVRPEGLDRIRAYIEVKGFIHS